MKTSKYAILAIIICTVFTSYSQLLWKFAAANLEFSLSLFTNWPLIFGCILYGLGAVIMLFAFRKGELSVLYPFLSLSFVWVALMSMFYLGESMTLVNWSGILAIIAGVSFIGRGAK